MLIVGVELNLDEILYLGLGFFATFLVLEGEGRRNLFWQLSLEVDLIKTGLKTSILNIEHLVLIFEELLAMLELIGVVNDSSLITVMLSGCVMADEGALFATLDLKLDMGAFDCLEDVDVDHTGNRVSWFIERILGL